MIGVGALRPAGRRIAHPGDSDTDTKITKVKVTWADVVRRTSQNVNHAIQNKRDTNKVRIISSSFSRNNPDNKNEV